MDSWGDDKTLVFATINGNFRKKLTLRGKISVNV